LRGASPSPVLCRVGDLGESRRYHNSRCPDALRKHRSLVKTWCMRGTLHLISASDLPVYVAARKTTSVVKRDWLTPEIDVEERKRIVLAIGEALDGQILTRERLAEEVVKRLGMSASVRKHMLSGW